MASLPIFDAVDLKGKTVLVRVDLNIPIYHGIVQDVTRITAIKATLNALIKMKCRVVLLSHFGRPNGQFQDIFSLKHLVPHLSVAFKKPIHFIDKSLRSVQKDDLQALKPGDIALLENLRFDPGEEKNDPKLAKILAKLGDFYINDAFSVSHRAHASVVAITRELPCAAGYLLQNEIMHLDKALSLNSQPLVAIIGGSKISTKIGLLKTLVKKVNTLVLGGGIANTFLLAQKAKVGTSLVEHDHVKTAYDVMQAAKANGCRLILPVDVKVAKDFDSHADIREATLESVHEYESIYDLGHQTLEHISDALLHAHTVIWNGPVGYFERPPFDKGSTILARTIGDLTRKGRLKSFAGGGETLAAISHAKQEQHFTFLSTGGGAFLEFIEGKPLPGIEALRRKD